MEFVIPIFVFYFITVLVLAAGAAKRYASLRKLAKRREGLYCTDRLYQKAVHRPKMLYRANLVIALLLLVSPFAYHANDTVAAGQNHLAVLSVADIVGGEKTESKGTPTTFYARHGFLYPEQLVSLEYAKWQGVYAKDKVVEDIALQYGACSARTPWLAALLADRLARYDDISGPYWFLDAPLLPQADAMGFDRLWGSVWRGGASTSIVALKGDVVYCVEISDANETVAMLAAALRAKIAQAKGP